MARVLFPLPALDFDPSEIAVSWRVLTAAGHQVSFATPDGRVAQCDDIMISGRGLDPWSPLPLIGRIKAIGLILRADSAARSAWAALVRDAAYLAPTTWARASAQDYDAVLLGGGHRARGMRAYLESTPLQRLIAAFFAVDKPVAAICHGVLLVARSRDATGRSVLHGRRTTALTWKQERTADAFARFGRFWDPHYYRTYLEEPGQPAGYMSVQQEITRQLSQPDHFLDVPADDPHFLRKTSGIFRDSEDDARAAWVVRDGVYVSARWPGDAHTFAKTFAQVLARKHPD